MNARRTNSDMFALGEWAGTAEMELNDAIDTAPDSAQAPLKALLFVLAEYKLTRNLTGLETLQRHWEKAAALDAKSDTLAKGDSRDEGAK